MVRISLRQQVLEVPSQDVITRDNVTLKVNAVVTLYVVNPNDAAIKVENYVYQTSQFSQTTLRSVLGEVELDSCSAIATSSICAYKRSSTSGRNRLGSRSFRWK
jgi:regulator of protease activity HflC (stomatin/prohibitin superfamily)